MIRAVIDTNVLVSAFIGRPGTVPDRVVRAGQEGRFEIVASMLLISEFAGVLRRPKFIKYCAEGQGGEFVEEIALSALIVDDVVDPPAVTPDRDDDYLVALARAAEVDYLVSGDSDLHAVKGVGFQVVTPVEFLAELDRRDA